MKKKASLCLIIAPLLYVYGLIENHFVFGNSIRGYSLDFIYEYINAWRILFNKEPIDNSVKVASYEYKLKSKKAKFDLDIALLMEDFYASWNIRFSKKERRLTYHNSGSYGDVRLRIDQISRDEFKVNYYDHSSWGDKSYLNSDYILNKEQTMVIIEMIKYKY